jgi:NADH:ubiquinone oxidoreductase subunit 6 (subunit J)
VFVFYTFVHISMGGRAVDPSLRAPWQRNLQIATVVVAALLSWSMVTIAPKYQRDATLNEEDSNRIAAAINTGDSKAVLEAVNQSVAAKTQ